MGNPPLCACFVCMGGQAKRVEQVGRWGGNAGRECAGTCCARGVLWTTGGEAGQGGGRECGRW